MLEQHLRFLQKRSIRFWVSILISISLMLTLGVSIYSGYKSMKQTLINNSLNMNYFYAQKLAHDTEEFFRVSKQTLQLYSEELTILSKSANGGLEKNQIKHELEELFRSTNAFNSVAYIDQDGVVQGTYPDSLNIIGQKLTSKPSLISLKVKKAYISEPYIAGTGNYLVLMTVPVWGKNGEYIGFLDGTVYLEEENALKTLLNKQFFSDESFVYVVDSNGRLIYHPNSKRIGKDVTENVVVQNVLKGKSGKLRANNTEGVDMLAGYAHVSSSKWGIVSQTPTKMALAPLSPFIKNMVYYVLPFFLIIILISLLFTQYIIKPLKQLADYSVRLSSGDIDGPMPKIYAWYFEAKILQTTIKQVVSTLQKRINYLTLKAHTDPLTGIPNRRTLDTFLEDWMRTKTPFSMLIADLDHFKQVNDTYGHDKGDEVLKFIVNVIREELRTDDVCGRYGGEEFMVLLPNANKKMAFSVAERIRTKIALSISPIGKPITVSIGISSFPEDGDQTLLLFKKADEAMYKAKQNGRNQTVRT